ncbi:hypothetical protein MKW94_028619 [Papaver nudicaule]|uniref:Uncharacterized protein n=1 Tax=Papaver nudicaule TaxID=74823 RepID=A0AA42B551_PAPNU|nr:hypothetical protein [Papaver nudicaule]
MMQSRRLVQTQSHKSFLNGRKKNDFLVEVPESDTLKMPMVLAAVALALFGKVLMMVCVQYDESKSQERIEHKIRNAPEGQGTVRMLSPEEWEEIQEVRPRTPFESKLARPNARLRTVEPLRMGIDVVTDALTRVEESVRRSAK